MSTDRIPVPAQPERKPFNAPLFAGALALVAVLAVVAFNVLRPQPALTVADLQSPVVGALGAGEALYPENSREGIREVVKFGYLPAVELSGLQDGTVVLADPESGQQDLGLDQPLDQTGTEEFLQSRITPAGSDEGRAFGEGTPMTWEQALEEFGDSTVFMPEVASADLVSEVLSDIEESGRSDGIIVRSSDPEVLDAAVAQDASALYTGDPAAVTPAELTERGVTMVALPVDANSLDSWLDSDIQIWVTDLESEGALNAIAARGAFGALAENPFTLQPSVVKTD
ncbi:hypothetical protein GCM10022261_08840 [Brevibacterium daeguense]|uniref:Uncharacterized protein n=1 Tax=Brevibacterium daeguense TaxID=909936 RepID=A0ABP8EHB0_9MICO|nr:hypothetical protein [Brevibacterium daeguense]